jgi:hypothetical protein
MFPFPLIKHWLLGVKRPGRGVDHLPPHSAVVNESAELYISTPCLGIRRVSLGELPLIEVLTFSTY